MASWVSRARELARAPPLFPEPGEDLARLLHALLPGEPAAAPTSR